MDKIETLNKNAAEWLAYILNDEGGGFGEAITEFVPMPSEDNNWLYDEESESFSGELLDDSGIKYSFVIKKEGEGWISSTKMAQESQDELEDEEPEMMGEDELEMMSEEEPDMASEDEESETQKMMMEELAKLREQVAKYEERERAKKQTELKVYCDGLYQDGKILESQMNKEFLFNLLLELMSVSDMKSMYYSEGAKQVDVLDGLKNLFSKLPQQVNYGEGLTAYGVNAPVVKYSKDYDKNSTDEYSAIKAYMKEQGLEDTPLNFRLARKQFLKGK